MKGFVLGLLVAAIAVGAFQLWQSMRAPAPPASLTMAPDAGPAVRKKKRRRGATRVSDLVARGRAASRAPAERPPAEMPMPPEDPEPEPVRLGPGDLRLATRGDDLGRPDVVQFDMSSAAEVRELSQDEIDARFRPEEPAILDCISRARPDPETYVPGRVTIKFRIQRTGRVRGVRVEAPSILLRGGLYECVRGIVLKLGFPAAGSSQIVSYPFALS